MPTRIYLPSTGAAEITPAFSADWEKTTGATRIKCVVTKITSSAASITSSENVSTSPYDVLTRQYVSDPLKAQTISGTVKGQIRCQEANADADYCAAMLIRVVSGDGTVERGVLLSYFPASLASEYATAALTNRSFPPSTALSPVVAQAGDRLVIEVGTRSFNVHTTSRNATHSFGDISGTDLPEDETTTTASNAWVEFSQDDVVLPIIYNPATNVVSFTGGDVGTPVATNNLWLADTTGMRILKAAAASPFTASLTTAVKPCEMLALKLSCVVTDYAGAGSVTLTGKDAWGNAISEVITINANGAFVSTLYYASVDANGVVAAGTFTVAIIQPRWGAFWKQSTNQYVLDCKITVGNGVVATYFKDSGKQIIIGPTAAIPGTSSLITVTTNAIFVLGNVVDEASKTTDNGCDIISAADWNFNFTNYTVAQGKVHLYSCSFKSLYPARTMTIRTHTAWNVATGSGVVLESSRSGTDYANYYNVTIMNTLRAVSILAGGTFDRLVSLKNNVVLYFFTSGDLTVSNVFARGTIDSFIYLFVGSGYNNEYLINVDSDIWTINWANGANTTIFRQYEFDLATEPSATAEVLDYNGDTALGILSGTTWTPVASVTADANGVIPTRNFLLQYYTKANGNVPVCSGPFWLRISKPGYQTYEKLLDIPVDSVTGYYNPASAFKLQVKLARAVPVFVGPSGFALNLRPIVSENRLVLDL